jgi:FKBP-type peptidyl-prolyl cis-trans isomerase FkpA
MKILLLTILSIGALCCGEHRNGSSGGLRSVFNPPALPPDTVPESLDYAADLQVVISEMAKLPVGVLYADMVAGDSGSGPPLTAGDSVEIVYQGWLPDGTKVDSGTAVLRVGAGDVISGIDAALPGMRLGGRRKLVLSPGLAYGPEGRDNIPPSAVLVYDVEVRAKLP